MDQNKKRTIVTRTLGDLSSEQRLWAHCEYGGHCRKLDLERQARQHDVRRSAEWS